MTLLSFLLLCVGALFAVAAMAMAVRSRFAVYGLSLVIAAAAAAAALAMLLKTAGVPETLVLPIGLPWLGGHFRLDALSAFFLGVVNFGAAAASLYGIGYGRHEKEPHRILPFFPAFIAGMNLVLLADDAFIFLLSWEFMSLASFALVLAHHRSAENRKAGFVYLTMASFGTLALLFAFGVLAGAGGHYQFAEMRVSAETAGAAALVTTLMLVGAGSKAGLVPLHVWLPLAHPAAPSHVSALMSGVMTKVAVYAFIRVSFDLMNTGGWSNAAPVMLLGGVTAVLGILHALMERDIKRLLAYSTIENIGVIFAMLGFALAFRANGMMIAASLALVAALFHVLNHSLFKSLLFFGAGSILNATGVKDIEQLGGLIRAMPRLAPIFLVGCVAISALPPFNGFASEWLAFQTVLQGADLPQLGLKVLAPAVGGLLALAAALAAGCFVRLFGVAFLGRTRSEAARRASDPDRWSLSAMGLLALLCALAGVLPAYVIDALGPVTELALGASLSQQSASPWLSVTPISPAQSSYNPLLLVAFIAFSATAAAFISRMLASQHYRRGPAWGCGFDAAPPKSQYTAMSFSQPVRRALGKIAFDAAETVEMPPPGSLSPAVFLLRMRDIVWDAVYSNIARAVDYAATRLNALQFLTIRRYLSLVFATLVILLLGLAAWS